MKITPIPKPRRATFLLGISTKRKRLMRNMMKMMLDLRVQMIHPKIARLRNDMKSN